LLKFGHALAERMALFDLVVRAAGEGLDPPFDSFEPRTDALETVIDGMMEIAEFALSRAGKYVNLFRDRLKLLFEAVKAFFEVALLHILGVYHSAVGGRAGSFTDAGLGYGYHRHAVITYAVTAVAIAALWRFWVPRPE
jgi:hypothetical protein